MRHRSPLTLAFTLLLALAHVFAVSTAAQSASPVNLAAVDEETMRHFQALVRMDTSDPPGNEVPAVEYLKRILEAEGIETKVFALDPQRPNLVARLRGNGSKRPLLIMAHTDTVNIDPRKWKHGPFSATREGGYVYGRGTVDDKDNVTSSLMTMLLLKRSKVALDRDVIFLAEAGEEIDDARGQAGGDENLHQPVRDDGRLLGGFQDDGVAGDDGRDDHAAEDRERFQKLLHELNLRQPPNRTARAEDEALKLAEEIGYPLVVRPSYVLGGRAMEIVHDGRDLERYMREAVKVSHDSPVLLDRFLNDAIECDVDSISDGQQVFIGGVMEHIEQAGVHSGDSACSLPPYSLSAETVAEIKRQTAAMARALNVVGLMNVQFAIQHVDGKDVIYVLEVNPRASRTVPYVSKATGIQLAKVAARCMAGQSLASQGITKEVTPPYFSVKEAVFPFVKFPGVDTILGPEMKSTGEVMGVGKTFGEAFVKSQMGAGTKLPREGKVFLTVKNNDKQRAVKIARDLVAQGFEIFATKGTAAAIAAEGVAVQAVNKVTEGRPHIVDMIKNKEIALVINTVEERRNAISDSRAIRTSALLARVTTFTTIAGAEAAVEGMKYIDNLDVISIQEMHAMLSV